MGVYLSFADPADELINCRLTSVSRTLCILVATLDIIITYNHISRWLFFSGKANVAAKTGFTISGWHTQQELRKIIKQILSQAWEARYNDFDKGVNSDKIKLPLITQYGFGLSQNGPHISDILVISAA